jgi:hypothetical protein
MNSSTPDLFSKPMAVTLSIQGLIPGKKNSKMLITKDPRGRPLRKPMLITKPDYQRALEKITESLRFQLLSGCQIGTGETLTASSLRSWIALSMPEDDAWTRIPEIHIRAELCEPGHEGATITIERL